MKNDYEVRGNITAIILKRRDGKIVETIIETDDLERVAEFGGRWCASWDSSCGKYYVVSTYQGKPYSLHRYLLNPMGLEVDHINRDPLDNRYSNLRAATRSQNSQNKTGAQKNSTSGIRNVHWHKGSAKWVVIVGFSGKHKTIGYFKDIEEAERAAIEARRKYMPFLKMKKAN